MNPVSDEARPWLIVGQVIKPHGIHGEMLTEIITDFPERMQPDARLGVGPAEGPDDYVEVFSVRYHKGRWLLALKDIRDRETVEGFRKRYLFLPEQDLEDLPEGYFYEHQLVGLRCVSTTGDELGEVIGLDPGEGQARLVVRRDRREHLVPYVPEIVREVDLEAATVTIDPPAGLLDDDAVMADGR